MTALSDLVEFGSCLFLFIPFLFCVYSLFNIRCIVAWCGDNRMAVNTDKIKAMFITTYQRFHKLPVKQLQIYINDQELQNVRVEKLLGVNIDQNMYWKPHTDKVHRTITMILVRLRQIKTFLPTDARIKFCQAFVFPHLLYCSCIWGSAQLGRLFQLQKRTARMIYIPAHQNPY